MSGQSSFLRNKARAFAVFVTLAWVTSGVAAAASGVIAFRVRDSRTGYAIPAIVKVHGAQPGQVAALSLRADEFGRFRRELPVGRYLVDVSASGYSSMESPYDVRPGANLPEVWWLTPELLPEELRPEVVDLKVRPGYTLVHGHIVDIHTFKPLAGVRVRIEKARAETRTDERGYYWVSAPTPPINLDVPGTDNMIVELPGYKTFIRRNFVLCDTSIGIRVDLTRGSGVQEHDDTHKLMRPQPPQQAPESAPPFAQARPANGPV